MLVNCISNLVLITLISLLLNIKTNAHDYPDYMEDYIDRRMPGTPSKYFPQHNNRRYLGPSNFADSAVESSPAKKRVKKSRRKDEIYADLVDPNLSVKDVSARLPIKQNPGIMSRAGGYCRSDQCFQCLESCKWLKKSRFSTLDITQYTYLRLCSEGCKDNLACLMSNYCLPVMEENPDFFVLCANKCNLFEIIPQVFRTGQCDR